MDLLQLEHFLAVVEEGSFTRAAERMSRTQPAISQSIKKLEDEMGAAAVCARRARPVVDRGGEGARRVRAEDGARARRLGTGVERAEVAQGGHADDRRARIGCRVPATRPRSASISAAFLT